MVIYRKQKEYNTELYIINQAIKAFEVYFKETQQEWKKGNKKSARLSTLLGESLGMINAKGFSTYEDPQITK